MMRNYVKTGAAVRFALGALEARLPGGWGVALATEGPQPTVAIRAPDARTACLRLVPRTNPTAKDMLALLAEEQGAENLLVVAPFLAPRAREVLAERGANYLDETGNLRLALRNPAVFMETRGKERDPERAPRPLQSLKGPAAARVVRALVDFRPPFTIRELSACSGTSVGTASRVITLLEQDALVQRDDSKCIVAVQWKNLLRRWTADYGIVTSNRLLTCLEPRVLDALAPKLARLPRYAVTGSLALERNIAPTATVEVYVDNPEEAARLLGVYPSTQAKNVWLLQPYDDVVYERTRMLTLPTGVQITAAAESQVIADLLSGPARGAEEAEAFMSRLQGNEDAWQRRR